MHWFLCSKPQRIAPAIETCSALVPAAVHGAQSPKESRLRLKPDRGLGRAVARTGSKPQRIAPAIETHPAVPDIWIDRIAQSPKESRLRLKPPRTDSGAGGLASAQSPKESRLRLKPAGRRRSVRGSALLKAPKNRACD